MTAAPMRKIAGVALHKAPAGRRTGMHPTVLSKFSFTGLESFWHGLLIHDGMLKDDNRDNERLPLNHYPFPASCLVQQQNFSESRFRKLDRLSTVRSDLTSVLDAPLRLPIKSLLALLIVLEL